MFKAELEFAGALTAVVALTPAQLASDDLSVVLAAGPTLRQRRQLALRALINNSLLEGGEARELIKDCVYYSREGRCEQVRQDRGNSLIPC